MATMDTSSISKQSIAGRTVGSETDTTVTRLRIATFASIHSPWGKAYSVWRKALRIRTKDALHVEFSFDGVEGPESSLLAKTAAGQLDGAVLSSSGLSAVYENVRVLELPGLVPGWRELESVRDAVRDDLEDGVRKELKGVVARTGLKIIHWSDVGFVRFFSKGFQVRSPNDLKHKRVALLLSNSASDTAILRSIGNVTVVASIGRSPPFDVMSGPARFPAVAGFDYVSEQVLWCAVGAMVMRAATVSSLAPDLRVIFEELQEPLTASIQKFNDLGEDEVLHKMKRVSLTRVERNEWEFVYQKARARFAEQIVDKALANRVLRLRNLPEVK